MAFKGPVLAILTTVAVVFLDDIPQMLRFSCLSVVSAWRFKLPVLAIQIAVVFLDDIPQMLRYWFLLSVGLFAEPTPVLLETIRYGENVMVWLGILCVGHRIVIGVWAI